MVWSQRVLIKIYERASRISSYIPSILTSLPSIPPSLSLSPCPFQSPSHSCGGGVAGNHLSPRENFSFLSFPLFECHRARIRGIRNELASREFTRHGIGPSVYFTLGSSALPPILGGCGFNRRSR